MKGLLLFLIFFSGFTIGTGDAKTLPPCPGAYNQKTWTNCVGATILPKGTTALNTGDHYRGEWLSGKPHGIGLLTGKKNGDFTYEGEFKEGLAHGQGTFTEEGQKYVGQWKKDQRHGVGTETLTGGGETYSGQWKNDTRHGMGTTKYFNGLTDTRRWKNGERVRTKKLQRLVDEFTKLKEQNDITGAILYGKKIIELSSKEFGQEHPELGVRNSVLGVYCFESGFYKDAEKYLLKALQIYKNVLGSNHPDTATTYNNMAVLLNFQARYSEAEKFQRQSLKIIENVSGTHNADFARGLNNLGENYRKQGLYKDAEPLFRKSIKIIEEVLGSDDPSIVNALNNLAVMYQDQSLYSKSEPILKKLVSVVEKQNGSEHPDLAISLNNLAVLYQEQGRFKKAELLFRRSLTIEEKTKGPEHPDIAISLNNLGLLLQDLARYRDAEKLLRRALRINLEKKGNMHPSTSTSLNNLGMLLHDKGRFSEAENLLQQGLKISEQALGPQHPDTALNLSYLGALLGAQMKYNEAISLFTRALEINQRIFGREHLTVAREFNNLGTIYQSQGQNEKAKTFHLNALEIYKKILTEDDLNLARSLNNLASIYDLKNDYKAAENLYQKVLKIHLSKLGKMHPQTAIVLRNIAYLTDKIEPSSKAEIAYRDVLLTQKKVLGPLHHDRVDTLQLFAGHYLKRELYKKAYQLHKQVPAHQWQDFKNQSHLAFAAYRLSLLPGQNTVALRKEAFDISQYGGLGSASTALRQMALRISARSSALSVKVRALQDSEGIREVLDKRLIQELSRPLGKERPQVKEALRARLVETRKKIGRLNEDIAAQFPSYAELTQTKPLKVKEVQRILGPGEALLAWQAATKIDDLEIPTYAWVVRRDGFEMFELDVGASELRDLVTAVRLGLDPKGGKLPKFDAEKAHTLYQKIFAPLEPHLKGIKHVMVVPDGPLQSIPLSVLVAQPPKLDTKPSWLMERYAMTTLPSVSSLRALRVLAKKVGKERTPFAGFGDPSLKGSPGNNRGLKIVEAYTGADVNAEAVRNLARLPETGEELREIARTLGAKEDTIYLGDRATEKTVKDLDLSGTRVLAFATHGLVAGELKRFAEPGLVMTPPKTITGDNDGVLTASEIAQLKLYPGLVILSACNTAAGDGSDGAEGLSGLARAFFYAGTKTLLVSHWSVPSESAKRLTTGMFRIKKDNPSIGQSEALRRSMMKLAANDNFSHPAYWAPFALVGEGMKK